ncbi:MAG: hypothetical protein RIE24_06320 [Silicimonas sp.]
MTKTPKIGESAKLTVTVSQDMTAARFAADANERFPEVLATPCLVADLERACAILLEGQLGDGELSVGAVIEIKHVAPTGVGGTYECRAIFSQKDGPLLWFDVEAHDAAGLIGKGRIARAIVNEQAILSRAKESLSNQPEAGN